ncbi:MAG: hypothetical protein ACLP19_04635 [Xanthobacteraceae bacterium]
MREGSERRPGRLKIFLGAAPGVGKTYAMLQAAQLRHRDGADVVIGLIETHGRQSTEELLREIELIPRKGVEYRGHVVEELDIDAILRRHPDLVVVDELAHSNVAGSRNAKRYLDVRELDRIGHRCVHDVECPAHRKPRHHSGQNHMVSGARVGSRQHP